jgi:hypothetical protein
MKWTEPELEWIEKYRNTIESKDLAKLGEVIGVLEYKSRIKLALVLAFFLDLPLVVKPLGYINSVRVVFGDKELTISTTGEFNPLTSFHALSSSLELPSGWTVFRDNRSEPLRWRIIDTSSV